MVKRIFVNLPVTDLPKSTAFYEAVGGTKNPMFSDDTIPVTATFCWSVSQEIPFA